MYYYIVQNESCISAVVLHEFKSENNSELDLYPGDTIVDLYVVDSDWMKGTLQSDVNKSGIFPSSFVKVNGKFVLVNTSTIDYITIDYYSYNKVYISAYIHLL